MKKIMLIAYIGFLFVGIGRILLDVFREEPFNYLNILISALSFFGILSYINKKLEYTMGKFNFTTIDKGVSNFIKWFNSDYEK